MQTFRSILAEVDPKLSEAELDGIIAEIDEDGSGTMDFEEFCELMMTTPEDNDWATMTAKIKWPPRAQAQCFNALTHSAFLRKEKDFIMRVWSQGIKSSVLCIYSDDNMDDYIEVHHGVADLWGDGVSNQLSSGSRRHFRQTGNTWQQQSSWNNRKHVAAAAILEQQETRGSSHLGTIGNTWQQQQPF